MFKRNIAALHWSVFEGKKFKFGCLRAASVVPHLMTHFLPFWLRRASHSCLGPISIDRSLQSGTKGKLKVNSTASIDQVQNTSDHAAHIFAWWTCRNIQAESGRHDTRRYARWTKQTLDGRPEGTCNHGTSANKLNITPLTNDKSNST